MPSDLVWPPVQRRIHVFETAQGVIMTAIAQLKEIADEPAA
ncbi:hypothetical protein ACGFNV_46210 [Streptomyces sp. NPDC048751]